MDAFGKDKYPAKNGDKVSRLNEVRHDIKNQLSNINLALEQLRFEIPDATMDCLFYIDSISVSVHQIDNLVKGISDN